MVVWVRERENARVCEKERLFERVCVNMQSNTVTSMIDDLLVIMLSLWERAA